MRARTLLLTLLITAPFCAAGALEIRDQHGSPMARVMVTRTPAVIPEADLSDDGYTPHGVSNTSPAVVTHFSDNQGLVSFDNAPQAFRYRARAQGYVDAYFDMLPEKLANCFNDFMCGFIDYLYRLLNFRFWVFSLVSPYIL